ncbi:MAG: SMP-30/gluconolactonase/LRE family protein [Verrucomicrobiota bacterium]
MLKRHTLLLLILSVSASPREHISAAEHPLKPEGRVAFTEGPAWHPSGNVYFSDIENNRIMRRDPSGKIHTYRTPSGRANGLMFDSQGRLIACEGHREGGNRRVTRTELDGSITILTDNFNGHLYNSPNDLAIDSKGFIYFTDPRYRERKGMEIVDADNQPIEGVYRLDPESLEVTQIITHEVARPNGIAISSNDKYLIVADNANDNPGDNRKLWRFNLNPDGTVDPDSQKLLFDWGTDRGPDGICIDINDTIYATAGFNHPNPPAQTADQYKAGVYLISIEGEHLDTIPVPMDLITNCTFGGPDLKTLYITAGHTLWSTPVETPGKLHWPKGAR